MPADIKMHMPENTKVLIRKEVKLYTLLNFFAEVGGYLGLLLGKAMKSSPLLGPFYGSEFWGFSLLKI